MEATTLIRGRGTHVWRRCTVLCILVVLCGLVVACNRQGPAVATEPPQPAQTPTAAPAANAEWGQDVAFTIRAGGREELLEGTPVALNVGDGVGVEKDGRVLLRFADLLTVEVLRAGELTVRELAIDEQAIFITVLQIAGTFVNDFHPQEAVRRRLSVESDFATITATGTRFLVVREANSPLEWVVALDAPPGDLEVTGEEGSAQPLTSGRARWVAPIGEPGEAIAADMQQVDAWLEGVRRGAPQPEIGEVVWPPADVVASTEPVPELPQPGTPFELEGVTLVLDPAGLFGAPEYALEDCNGDGIRDVAIRRGKVWMDFRPVLRRVRALDVTLLNRGQPRSGALRVLDPAQGEIVRQQVEVDAGQTQVLSLRSGEPYHYAELLMTDGCFLGFSLTPPREDGTPGEARSAIPTASPTPTPPAEPASPTPPTAAAPACTVLVDTLNLRAGPGTGSAVLQTLPRGTSLQPLTRSADGGWIEVRVVASGVTGWVSSDPALVNCTPPPGGLPTGGASPTPVPPPTEQPISPTAGTTCVPLAREFEGLWQATAGCPTSGLSQYAGASQYFTGGQMLWRQDLDRIYVFAQRSGRWSWYPDNWNEGDPEISCAEAAPTRLPKRGFGAVWCAQAGVRQDLGSAITPEVPVTLLIQTTASAAEMFYVVEDVARYLLLASGTYVSDGTVPPPPTITPTPGRAVSPTATMRATPGRTATVTREPTTPAAATATATPKSTSTAPPTLTPTPSIPPSPTDEPMPTPTASIAPSATSLPTATAPATATFIPPTDTPDIPGLAAP